MRDGSNAIAKGASHLQGNRSSRRPSIAQALEDLDESLWKEAVRRVAKIQQRPPAMGRDSRGLVVVRAAHANLRGCDSSKEMPFVLVKRAASIHKARAPALNDGAQIGNVEAEFLDQLPTGRFFRRLAGLDATTWRIPIRTSVWILVKEEQQTVLLIEEKHARNLANGRWQRLHLVRSLVAAGVCVNRGRPNTHSARQEASTRYCYPLAAAP